MLRRTVLAIAVRLIIGASTAALPAVAASDPATFIDNLSTQLQALVRNTSPQQRFAGFRELFRKNFDIPGLGRFIAGRFWRVFTPSEQQQFLGLFEDYVVFAYSDRLSEYARSGDVLRVTGNRRQPDGMLVSSEITRGSRPSATRGPTVQPIKIDWRLTARDGSYQISDVIIDGLSMAANGRSELERVVERNGGRANSILAVMRQQIASAVFQ
jgi:phospholipid transport system substrate-binding protein